MERNVKDVRTLVEDLLGPIAVVGVPVEHHDALALCGDQTGGDGDVVEQAEAHGPRPERVVSGGSHREKGDIAFAVPEAFDRVQARTGGTQGRVEGGRGCDGVLVEVSAAAQAMILYALDVQRVVNDLELSPCCPSRFERDGHFGRRRVCDAGEDRLQALRTLRVPLACCVCCELLVTSEQHYHSTTVPPPRLERGGDPAVVPVSERSP